MPSSDNGRLTQLKVVNGVLYTTTRFREKKTYTIANRNEQERLVLLEHPVRMADGDFLGNRSTHGITQQVNTRDVQIVQQRDNVRGRRP